MPQPCICADINGLFELAGYAGCGKEKEPRNYRGNVLTAI